MKINRHSKIMELIAENEIETQEELTILLNRLGFSVTQATVSRDIREIGLIKEALADGRQKYSVMSGGKSAINDRLIRVFKDCVVSIDCAVNLIVIKTLPGTAMAVGAVIDAMGFSDALGTIAGDDTLFCAVKTEKKAGILAARLKEI